MKKCWVCLVPLCLHLTSPAQYYFYDGSHLESEWTWETGISLGWMNCLTDLGGGKGNGKKFIKDINWKNGKPCGGIFVMVTHREVIGLRLEWSKGAVTAYDSILKNEESVATLRYRRNLQFKSSINEWSLLAEFHPLSLTTASQNISPYLLFGVGYFHFDPEAYLDGEWIRLQPLHTEGEGFHEFPERNDYKLQQLNFPVGCGFKYDVSALLNIRLELLYRILVTDYLDDVSTTYIDPILFNKYLSPTASDLARRLADRTLELDPMHQTQAGAIRGHSQNNDSYFSISLKVTVILNRKRY
jgi:hypothetical protein